MYADYDTPIAEAGNEKDVNNGIKNKTRKKSS